MAEVQEASDLTAHKLHAVQQHLNVLFQDEADADYRAFCKEHGIAVVAYTPVARGRTDTQELKNVAAKYDATAAQISLAWLLAVGTLPIPKAAKKQHIDENLAALSITLDSEDVKLLTFR